MRTLRSRSLRFESLEHRTVLSANLSNGVVTVVGTESKDVILVDIPASGPHAGELEVNVNGVLNFFNAGSVNSIQISGLGGNDRITINDVVSIDATISGGDGRDSIKGGSGNDTIHGDNGNDVIQGSAGADILYGDLGNDVLYGGDGDDYLDGGKGNDIGHGGLGDDRLKGGEGNDHLDGDQGNNLLDGDQGRNHTAHGVTVDLDSEFEATLTGVASMSGTASFEWQNNSGQAKTIFDLQVQNLLPSSTLDVTIDGVVVGQITTDLSGQGELKFSSNPSGGELPFPSGFPTIHSNSTISVQNSVQGSFVAKHAS